MVSFCAPQKQRACGSIVIKATRSLFSNHQQARLSELALVSREDALRAEHPPWKLSLSGRSLSSSLQLWVLILENQYAKIDIASSFSLSLFLSSFYIPLRLWNIAWELEEFLVRGKTLLHRQACGRWKGRIGW